jgi:hypothetical protein
MGVLGDYTGGMPELLARSRKLAQFCALPQLIAQADMHVDMV